MKRFMPNNKQSRIPEGPFVFLGGTCNSTTWRERLVKMLEVPYFDPVIKEGDWTEDDARIENQAKTVADVSLYVITPSHTGLYSIAEMSVAACCVGTYKFINDYLGE
jgi:hypothetical protein